MTNSIADVFLMAQKCREEHCGAEIKKRREAIMIMGDKEFLSRKEQARRFELRFQRRVLGETKTRDEIQMIDAELSDIYHASVNRRKEEIKKLQEVIDAQQCELDHCQDTLIAKLATELNSAEKSCIDGECKMIIEDMAAILEKAKQDKLTSKMHSDFMQKNDELFDALMNNDMKGEKETSIETPNDTPEDRYYTQKRELLDAGLKHQKCRELFINRTVMTDEFHAKMIELEEMKKQMQDIKDDEEKRKIELKRMKEIVKFEYETGVYSCILGHADVSMRFEELLRSAQEYLRVLRKTFEERGKEKEKKEANNVNQINQNTQKRRIKSLEKLIHKIATIQSDYNFELSNSKKARLLKEFKIAESKIGLLTNELLGR